jgi:hypothetical protein
MAWSLACFQAYAALPRVLVRIGGVFAEALVIVEQVEQRRDAR